MAPSGSAPSATFRERLWPGPGSVVAAACLGLVLGLVLWLVSETWSVAVGVVAALALVAGLLATSPVVAVGPGPDGEAWLWAGRARIPVSLLAEPDALDAAGLRTHLGPGSDARTFAVLRPWIRTAVAVRVVDPQDPTPSWLVGTRRPAALAAALAAAGARPAAAGPDAPGAAPGDTGTAATRR